MSYSTVKIYYVLISYTTWKEICATVKWCNKWNNQSMGVSLLLWYVAFIHCQVSSPLFTGTSLQLRLQAAPVEKLSVNLQYRRKVNLTGNIKTPSPTTSPNVDAAINGLHEHYLCPSMTAVDTEHTATCNTKFIHIVLISYPFTKLQLHK